MMHINEKKTEINKINVRKQMKNNKIILYKLFDDIKSIKMQHKTGFSIIM